MTAMKAEPDGSPSSAALASRLASFAYQSPSKGKGKADAMRNISTSPTSTGIAGPSTPASTAGSRAGTRRNSRRFSVVLSPHTSSKRRRQDASDDDSASSYMATSAEDVDDPLTPSKSATRGARSKRKTQSPLLAVKDELLDAPSSIAQPSTGKKTTPKKVPRPFAPPEVYAHLKQVPDHVVPNLNSMFPSESLSSSC